MNPLDPNLTDLLRGPLLEAAGWPIALSVRFCDLGRSFLPKGRGGNGYRAVARNGRVLLASDRPAAELAGRNAHVRLQTWHRRVLPDDPLTPFGILLHVRGEDASSLTTSYETRLVRDPQTPYALALDLGGRLVLEFHPR